MALGSTTGGSANKKEREYLFPFSKHSLFLKLLGWLTQRRKKKNSSKPSPNKVCKTPPRISRNTSQWKEMLWESARQISTPKLTLHVVTSMLFGRDYYFLFRDGEIKAVNNSIIHTIARVSVVAELWTHGLLSLVQKFELLVAPTSCCRGLTHATSMFKP